jgi:transcriptional regulator with PAS, ATPase and Fis domain
LRVLQEKEIERVGGNRIVPVDVRVIAATHKNLEQMVARGEFREDLYYRLNVIPLYIPPLRERTGDILMLSEHFIKKYNALLGKNIKGLSKEATSILVNYSWPGNVRELENCIEYAVNMETQDLIQLKNLPERIMKNRNLNIKQDLYGNFETQKIKKEISAVEEKEIINTLKRYSGVPRAKEKAAQELGISRATLYRKIKELKNRGVTIL